MIFACFCMFLTQVRRSEESSQCFAVVASAAVGHWIWPRHAVCCDRLGYVFVEVHFFFPFAEWMRKQFKVKVAFSKKIKKGYLVKRPKRPLIFWTKRLPKSLKVLYFFWVSTPSNPVRAPKRHPTTAWRRWKVTDQQTAPKSAELHDAGAAPRKKGSGFDWRCFTFTFWSSLHDFFGSFFWGEKFL